MTAKKDSEFATFVPTVDFRGYPEDYKVNRKGVEFTACVESVPVPRDFAEMVVNEKGLGTDIKAVSKADAKAAAGD